MDLHSVALQVRLDALAVQVSRSLRAQGIPHVLIKGVTTARWLYDPPRSYRDVDVLVPGGSARRAAATLIADGVIDHAVGRPGEEASHSWRLVTAAGAEVDLHLALPGTVRRRGSRADQLWHEIASHVTEISLDTGTVPALDLPARLVTLGCHAVSTGGDARAVEDLRRALLAVTGEQRATADALARRLSVAAELECAAAYVETGALPTGAPRHVRAAFDGVEGARLRLARLARAHPADVALELLTEIFPSRDLRRSGTLRRAGTIVTSLLRRRPDDRS